MTHQFSESLKIDNIATYFAEDWEITRASILLQKVGIGFLFKSKKSGEIYSIELKTDYRAWKTQNAFIETESTENQKGWAYTCKADLIFYYIPQGSIIYSISPTSLRSHIFRWQRRYSVRSVPNQGQTEQYTTKGILVPLSEFERRCNVINM
jgi:hypothetical protein